MRAALNLLGYNQSDATLVSLMADPSLTTVLNSTLEALKPDTCSRAPSASATVNPTVWDQIKNFIAAFSDNPAGASLSVSVVVIAAVTVYVLIKYINHRIQNVPMRAARVWEFAQTMRNFMARLIPGSDADLQVDDLASLEVPDPDIIVALERGTGRVGGDPPSDYYSPVEQSDQEDYATPFDTTMRAASLPRSRLSRYPTWPSSACQECWSHAGPKIVSLVAVATAHTRVPSRAEGRGQPTSNITASRLATTSTTDFRFHR